MSDEEVKERSFEILKNKIVKFASFVCRQHHIVHIIDRCPPCFKKVCFNSKRFKRINGLETPCTHSFRLRYAKVDIMPLARDLLHPTQEDEKRRYKLKRLVQTPTSWMSNILACTRSRQYLVTPRQLLCVYDALKCCANPQGGRARVTEVCSFRRKQH